MQISPDVVSYGTAISCFDHSSQWDLALHIFHESQRSVPADARLGVSAVGGVRPFLGRLPNYVVRLPGFGACPRGCPSHMMWNWSFLNSPAAPALDMREADVISPSSSCQVKGRDLQVFEVNKDGVWVVVPPNPGGWTSRRRFKSIPFMFGALLSGFGLGRLGCNVASF